MLKNIIAPKM